MLGAHTNRNAKAPTLRVSHTLQAQHWLRLCSTRHRASKATSTKTPTRGPWPSSKKWDLLPPVGCFIWRLRATESRGTCEAKGGTTRPTCPRTTLPRTRGRIPKKHTKRGATCTAFNNNFNFKCERQYKKKSKSEWSTLAFRAETNCFLDRTY